MATSLGSVSRPLVVWDPRMLGYDFGGHHPMRPLRWEMTWLLAGSLGVLDGFEVFAPGPADDQTLGLVHTSGYIDAVRRASGPDEAFFSVGHGLGTPVRVVPRSWTHLLAIVSGHDLDPAAPLPEAWLARAAAARPETLLPVDMSDGVPNPVTFPPWDGTVDLAVDRAILDTRSVIDPRNGVDPVDPRH